MRRACDLCWVIAVARHQPTGRLHMLHTISQAQAAAPHPHPLPAPTAGAETVAKRGEREMRHDAHQHASGRYTSARDDGDPAGRAHGAAAMREEAEDMACVLGKGRWLAVIGWHGGRITAARPAGMGRVHEARRREVCQRARQRAPVSTTRNTTKTRPAAALSGPMRTVPPRCARRPKTRCSVDQDRGYPRGLRVWHDAPASGHEAGANTWASVSACEPRVAVRSPGLAGR